MNQEAPMREELLQHNGIQQDHIPEMKSYKSGFSINRIFRYFLILLDVILWVAVAVSHIVFTAMAFSIAMSDTTHDETALTMTIACITEPFLIAAAGILTYYLYTQSKQVIMSDIQKRLMQIEKQLAGQTNK